MILISRRGSMAARGGNGRDAVSVIVPPSPLVPLLWYLYLLTESLNKSSWNGSMQRFPVFSVVVILGLLFWVSLSWPSDLILRGILKLVFNWCKCIFLFVSFLKFILPVCIRTNVHYINKKWHSAVIQLVHICTAAIVDQKGKKSPKIESYSKFAVIQTKSTSSPFFFLKEWMAAC